jgi:hypothetical protein
MGRGVRDLREPEAPLPVKTSTIEECAPVDRLISAIKYDGAGPEVVEELFAHLASGDTSVRLEAMLIVGIPRALSTVRVDGPTAPWMSANVRQLNFFLTYHGGALEWVPTRADVEAFVDLRDRLLAPNQYSPRLVGEGGAVSRLIGHIDTLQHMLKVLPPLDQRDAS